MNIAKILFEPVVTESSLRVAKDGGVYTFKVAPMASKDTISRAIELMYGVKVLSVRTLLVKQKTRMYRRKIGKMASWKKAFVVLEKGQSIDFEQGT